MIPRLSDNKTVQTVKLAAEIELLRTETVTRVTCTHCSLTGEVRKVELKPPANVGSSITYRRVPDGWWVHGSSLFEIKATCSGCFEKPFAGVLAVDEADSE